MRVQARPDASAPGRRCASPTSRRRASAVRALAQSGLLPANCRLLDAREAALTRRGDGAHALLVLGFESTDHAVDAWFARALELCTRGRRRAATSAARDDGARRRGGRPGATRSCGRPTSATRSWPRRAGRDLRDGVHLGSLRRACTPRCIAAAERGRCDEVCGGGMVTCRFTHVYPDGAGALLHGDRPRAARRGARAVGRDQSGRLRRAARARAARSPITTPSAATTAPGTTASAPSRSRAALRAAKAAARPGWHPQPRRADRPAAPLNIARAGGRRAMKLACSAPAASAGCSRARSPAPARSDGGRARADRRDDRRGGPQCSVTLGDLLARRPRSRGFDEPSTRCSSPPRRPGCRTRLSAVAARPDRAAALNGLDHVAVLRERFVGRVAATIRVEGGPTRPRCGRALPVPFSASKWPRRRRDGRSPTRCAPPGSPRAPRRREAQVMWSKLVRLNALA